MANELSMARPYVDVYGALEEGRQRAVARRQEEEANALSQAIRAASARAVRNGMVDPRLLGEELAQSGYAYAIPSAQEKLFATQKAAGEATEAVGKGEQAQIKVIGDKMQSFRQRLPVNNPRLLPAWVEAVYADPDLGPFMSQFGTKEEVIAGIPQDAAGVAQWMEGASMAADEVMKRRTLTAEQEAAERERVFQRGITERELGLRGQELKVSQANVGLRGQEANLAERKFQREGDLEFQSRAEQMKAASKFKGEALARAEADLPGAITRADTALDLIDQMVGKLPEKDASGKVTKEGTRPHPGFRAAVGAGIGERFIPGTDAAGFQALYDQVTGGAFLQAYETLKGTGQITEVEGKKATAAITRMNLAQNEKEFIAAAREFQSAIRTGVKNARVKAGKPAAVGASARTTTGGTSYEIIED